MAANHAVSSDPDPLPDEVVDDLLSADRRRIALEILSEADESVIIDDLVAAVRAREAGVTPEEIDSEERRAVRDEFFQRHLPKLTATEVVDYNSLLGTVSLTAAEQIEAALD